ncbi:MAG: sulfate reduction electron transfer complex DsrMKJOP subunit DsrO [Bacillota bacterium]
MDATRRRFLRMAGATAAGLALFPVARALATGKGSAAGTGATLPARKWAMAVDMKKCRATEGCRQCMRACHLTHNVPQMGDSNEAVKWIWAELFPSVFPSLGHDTIDQELEHKSFPVLCNHCVNAPCVRVCPTRATFKREDGIVMMDYHRCIGCRYCMAACPYGARSFNFRDPRPSLKEINPAYPTREKGVVEKCNFCAERLAAGAPPACVAACPHGALIFGDLEDPGSEIRRILRTAHALRRKAELGTEPKVYYLL